jgi:hypothetical protein
LGAVDPKASFIGIFASSLDDPSWFRPQYHIFVADAQPWDLLDPALPKFQHYAPEDNSQTDSKT